jgi:DNA-binding NtrC family response regulator
MESFIQAIGPGSGGAIVPTPSGNPFAGLERLPTFGDAAELLVEEAMRRAAGNQSLAARLLGISQPALSKRLKQSRIS